MGNNIQNICKNNSYCLKQEIKKIETNDLNDSTIKLSKKKTPKFNNFQITSVISESIIDQKKEDFDKKSIPLNQDFSLEILEARRNLFNFRFSSLISSFFISTIFFNSVMLFSIEFFDIFCNWILFNKFF